MYYAEACNEFAEPSPRHCTWATQLLSQKCHSSGEPSATLRPIRQARDLNLRSTAPETNALPLDQQAGKLTILSFFSRFICSKICPFIQSASLFSAPFTRSTNMSNQISQIYMTTKESSQQEETFLLQSSFSPRVCF